MNINIVGHHLEVTKAIEGYVEQKLSRVWRHFSNGQEANVVLSVEKREQKAEITVHFQGKDLHAESKHDYMYAAIDLLADKLDRQVLRYKEQHQSGGHPSRVAAKGLDQVLPTER